MKKSLTALLIAVVIISSFSMTVSAASGSYVGAYISSAASDDYGIYLSVTGCDIAYGLFETDWSGFPYGYHVGGYADSVGYFHEAEMFSGGHPSQCNADWAYCDVAYSMGGIQNWGSYPVI